MKTTPKFVRGSYSKNPKIESMGLPVDLDSAIYALIKILGENGVKTMKSQNESAWTIDNSHEGLGRWMRNNWKLWIPGTPLREFFFSLGIQHPDDMAMLISRSTYRYAKQRPIELENQVKEIRKYLMNRGYDPDNLKIEVRKS